MEAHTRPRRDTHNLDATHYSWRSNKVQPRVSPEAEQRLWLKFVDSCRAIVADAEEAVND